MRLSREGGVPVLAVHGWLDNAASFAPLAPYLSGLDVVAMDLPGHGHSQHRSADSSYMFVDWVKEVFAAADALGWQKFHLLGHSLGASVCILAAVTDPQRVLSVCALDGFMPVTAEPLELVSRLRDYVRDALRDRRTISFATEEDALQVRARAGQFENNVGLRAMVVRNIEQNRQRWELRFDHRLLTHNPLRLTQSQLEELARALTVPAHVVVADDGLDFVKVQIATLGPLIATFSKENVAGFHHVHLDAPERVAPLIRRFFDRQ